jgi:hypothetical protein
LLSVLVCVGCAEKPGEILRVRGAWQPVRGSGLAELIGELGSGVAGRQGCKRRLKVVRSPTAVAACLLELCREGKHLCVAGVLIEAEAEPCLGVLAIVGRKRSTDS